MLAAIILGGLFVWNIGSVLVAPSNHSISPPPASLHAEIVEFPSASGATIHGWFIPRQPGRGAVALLHGVHADWWTTVARAEFLTRAGYSVLLFDFQGHGESLAKQITSVSYPATLHEGVGYWLSRQKRFAKVFCREGRLDRISR